MKIWNIRVVLFFLVASLGLAGCKKTQSPAKYPPVVNAGASMAITLPVNSVTVTGAVTGYGSPIKSYLWSQLAGPSASSIVNPASASTSITGLVEGTYIFQFMATDTDGLTGSDTMTVLVNPNPTKTVTLLTNNEPYDRMIVSINGVDQSFTGSNEWVIDAWTVNGNPYFGRKAFKIDFGAIPSTATIVSANLYLYSNSPPENGNLINANFGTNNALYLQRITAAWTPSTTTWNNQPATTTTDQVSIPHTAQSTLDLNVDVTKLVQTMVVNGNYGFLLKLQNEVAFTSRQFVSTYHASKVDKHPKLVIVYN